MKNINNNILYDILSQKVKTVYSVLELLDWNESYIGEIQGEVTDGNLSVNGDSIIRRTLSLGMVVNDMNKNITEVNNHISLNKKVRVKIGVSNDIQKYKSLGDIVWFNLGVYIFTDGSANNDVNSGANLSVTAIDKMGLLSGDISGQIQTPTEFHVSYDVKISDDGEIEYEKKLLTMHEMIKYAVIGLGGENPSKVIINDVPLEIRTPIKYTGKHNMYYDDAGNPYTPEEDGLAYYPDTNQPIDPDNLRPGYKIVRPDDYAGYELVPFTYPGDLVKQPGDTITSVLDSIKNALGNYEYFYDTDGNFIFQEIRNFINTSFTPLTELESGDYVADFTKQPIVFSFVGTDIISAYNNTPDWKNIKNDYIVWGMPRNDSGGQPVMYHLAVDEKPILPTGYNEPWQKYLVDYGDEAIKNPTGQDLNSVDAGRYYAELKGKLPQVYNFEDIVVEDKVVEKKGWKSDPSGYTYYLDFIDSKSEFGKYSINSIGKRTISIIDDNVTTLYPPEVPDIVILPNLVNPTQEEEQERRDYISHLNRIGLKFIQVDNKDWGRVLVSQPYAKDAYGVVRDLLFYHTTFNETISLTSIPMYFLDVNQMIAAENEQSNISGEYLIKSISLPLGVEGAMSISAIRSVPRL